MNERIRELAKQARQLAADEHTNGDEYKLNINDDSYYVQELIQEKFAELIVRECAKLVEDNIDPQNAWITPGYIKQYFGVK